RRGQAEGRLRRLRQARLLQYAHDGHASGFNADGENPEEHPGSIKDLRTMWAAQVLPAIRTGCLRRVSEAVTERRHPRTHSEGPRPRAGPGNPRSTDSGRIRGRAEVAGCRG